MLIVRRLTLDVTEAIMLAGAACNDVEFIPRTPVFSKKLVLKGSPSEYSASASICDTLLMKNSTSAFRLAVTFYTYTMRYYETRIDSFCYRSVFLKRSYERIMLCIRNNLCCGSKSCDAQRRRTQAYSLHTQ